MNSGKNLSKHESGSSLLEATVSVGIAAIICTAINTSSSAALKAQSTGDLAITRLRLIRDTLHQLCVEKDNKAIEELLTQMRSGTNYAENIDVECEQETCTIAVDSKAGKRRDFSRACF